jgi:hypothetical protein
MGNPGSISAAVPYGEDKLIRRQQDLETRVREEAAARRLARSQIGAGGVIKVDGTLQVTGDLEIPAGALSSAGSMSAGATVTAGTDVHAGDDLIADDDLIVGGDATIGSTLNVAGASYFPHAYANPVTTSYFAAYLNGDNRLGRTVSSRRYKSHIEAWNPDVQAIFALQLVTFRLKAAVEEMGSDAPIEWGLIAEELVELGLDWLVIFVDGEPEGIAYEKIALAMLPAVQDHERRIARLEELLVAPGGVT